jgi:hypothetical protein
VDRCAAIGATDNDTAGVAAASAVAAVTASNEDGFQEIRLSPPTDAGDQGPQRVQQPSPGEGCGLMKHAKHNKKNMSHYRKMKS